MLYYTILYYNTVLCHTAGRMLLSSWARVTGARTACAPAFYIILYVFNYNI